jgi:hypothetical protein
MARVGTRLLLILAAVGSTACPAGRTSYTATPPSERRLSFALPPGPRQVAVGSSATYDINVQELSPFGAAVEFRSVVAPAGLSARIEPNPLTSGRSAALVVEVPAGASIETYSVMVEARLVINGQPEGSWVAATTQLQVVANQGDFTIACDPAVLTILPGQTRTTDCQVVRSGGFVLAVDIAVGNAPDALVITPSGTRIEGDDRITIRIARNPQVQAPNVFDLRVIGSAAGASREVAVRLFLNAL